MLQDCSCWRPKLQSAVGGAAFAADDPASSQSRSDQCELYFMATFLHAGFAISLAEPDLLVRINKSVQLAVAVKRPRSEARIVRNIRAAAKQIARKDIPGIVAVDLSFIERIEKPLYVRESAEQLVPAVVLLDVYAKQNQRELLRAATGVNTLGLLLHLSCGVRSLRPHLSMVSRRWLMLSHELDPRLDRLVRAIQSLGAKPISSGNWEFRDIIFIS